MVEFDFNNGIENGDAISQLRLAAIIPAYNECQGIEELVKLVNQRAFAIVVDDGSSDNTAKLAQRAGAFVIIHPVNRGYDAALETGILAAISLGCIFAVTLDADGQHDPALLDTFRAELESGADLIVGVRDQTQRWSEELFGHVSRILWGLTDPLCGIKGYRLNILKNESDLNTYSSIGTELTIRAIKANFKLKQLPVVTNSREGISRFGSGIKANLQIMKALFRGLFYAKKLKRIDSM